MAVQNTAPTLITARTGFVTGHDFAGGSNSIVELKNGKLFAVDLHHFHQYNPDGTHDSSVGNDGAVTIRLNGNTQTSWLTVRKMHLLPDGKVLVSGIQMGSVGMDYSFFVARLYPDGSLDPTFGNGTGRTTTNLDVGRLEYNPVTAVMEDGRIVVATSGWEISSDNAGTAQGMRIVLARYMPDGSLDQSFGSKGIVIGSGIRARVENLTVQADGKVIVAGTDVSTGWGQSFDIHRFNADGSVDTSFSQDGQAQTYFESNGFNQTAWAFSVTVQADGKIVAVGQAPGSDTGDTSKQTSMAVVRYNADGSLDFTFGIGGKVIHFIGQDQGRSVLRGEYSAAMNHAYKVHILDDGKILVAGITHQWTVEGGGTNEFALMRLHPDGRLDEQFGTNGIATFAPGLTTSLTIEDLLVRADGTIVLSGASAPKGATVTHNMIAAFNSDGTPDASFGTPAISNQNTATYLAGHPDQFLNTHLQVSDAQLNAAGNYAGASVSLARSGGANSNDLFAGGGNLRFVDGHAILNGVDIGTVSNSGGTLRITFGASATQARVNEALQSIAYENIAAAAGQEIKIDWLFGDGNTGAQGDGGALTAAASTLIKVAKTDVPYWIAGMLQPDSTTPTAAALKASLSNHLGSTATMKLAFAAAAGAAEYSASEKTFIQSQLAGLEAVAGIGFGTGTDTLTISKSIELAAGEASATKLDDDGAQITVSFAPEGTPAGAYANSAALVHGLGHAFGLKHGDEPGIGGGRLPAGENTLDFTAMADAPATPPSGAGDPGLRVLDIAALQYIYGPSKSARTGDDTYVLSASTHNFIWDGAGIDTISAAGLSTGVTLHLEPGHWDYIGLKGRGITAAGQVTVNYGTLVENALGGRGNDSITGNSAANSLGGGEGADRLQGLGGNDKLDGGAGVDTAVFTGKRGAYTIGGSLDGITVTGNGEGADTLLNVERIQFADAMVAIDIAGSAGQVFRLYTAVFGRAPDAAGFGYWLGAMDGGMTARAMASYFIAAPEFTTLYGAAPDSATLLNKLYENVLHRAADPAGFKFWQGVLDAKAVTQTEVLLSFSDSAENVAQVVGQIENGIVYIPF